MVTLTLEEAAQWLKMHPHTLEKKVRAGQIPGAKPGRRWVFLEEDLAEWIRKWSRQERRLDGRRKTFTCSIKSIPQGRLIALFSAEGDGLVVETHSVIWD